MSTLDDYRAVHQLVGDMYEASTTGGAGEAVRTTVDAVAELTRTARGGHVSVTQLSTKLGISKMSASRRVSTALKGGWLVNDETRKGLPSALRVGEALPARQGLPDPADLERCNAIPTLTNGLAEQRRAAAVEKEPSGDQRWEGSGSQSSVLFVPDEDDEEVPF